MLVVIVRATDDDPLRWESLIEGYRHSPRAEGSSPNNAAVHMLYGLGLPGSATRCIPNDDYTKFRIECESVDLATCSSCGGRGDEMPLNIVRECPDCNGVGFLLPDGETTQRGRITATDKSEKVLRIHRA